LDDKLKQKEGDQENKDDCVNISLKNKTYWESISTQGNISW